MYFGPVKTMETCYPPFNFLVGEEPSLQVASPVTAKDCAAVVYYRGNTDKICALRPCSLAVSQFRIIIGVQNTAECITLPLMGVEKWRGCRGTIELARAFAQLKRDARCGHQQDSDIPFLSVDTEESTFAHSLFVISLQSKHLWEYHLVLQDERLVRNIRRSLAIHSSSNYITELPAFSYAAARSGERKCHPQPSHADGTTVTNGTSLGEMWDTEFGWCLYSAKREFHRQLCVDPSVPTATVVTPETIQMQEVGVGKDLRPWFRLAQVLHAPDRYNACPTYPDTLWVPSSVDDKAISQAMQARSRGRVPVVSYVHLGTGAVLARSSQPLMGSSQLAADATLCYALINNEYSAHRTCPSSAPGMPKHHEPVPPPAAPPPSLFDEPVEDVASMNASSSIPEARGHRTLNIVDCRPYTAALANSRLGGGFETGVYYHFCRTRFCDIDNIFAVVKSFHKLRAVLAQFQGDVPAEGFLKCLHNTQWLQHVQRILVCSASIAESLVSGESCLVHCTDGWDRTAQCCATAMLLLDPFYRTTIGFCVLLEKEFCSLGHKFAERNAHHMQGRTSFSTNGDVVSADTEHAGARLQASPIFVQFLDVVYQVMRQFPRAFEFTPQLLQFLAEAGFSCLYGTFLCNCEQERFLEGVKLRTSSAWTDVLRHVALEKAGELPLHLVNGDYDAETAWRCISRTEGGGTNRNAGRIIPNCNSKRIVFWEDFYLKYDSDGTGSQSDMHQLHSLRGNMSKRRLHWGAPFEKFLEKYISDACEERKESLPRLQDIEKSIEETFGCGYRAQPPSREKSIWGAFDSSVCFACYKSFGMWGGRTKCDRCKQTYCPDCVYKGSDPTNCKWCVIPT